MHYIRRFVSSSNTWSDYERSYPVRPIITLRSIVNIDSGGGTKSDPYTLSTQGIMIYRWSDSHWDLNQNISLLSLGTDYVRNKLDLPNMDSRANMYYLKHKVMNDVITENYSCFVVTNAMVQNNSAMTAGEYCLKGGSSSAMANNRNILTTAFGNTNCTENNNNAFVCNAGGLNAYVRESSVSAGDGYYDCLIESDGSDCSFG